jgi:cysteine desulfurase family protein (TIGR01976 family)
MTKLDTESIRKRFPALQRDVGGKPAIFADAPGGTQVPESVIDAIANYLSVNNANEGGAFATSEETGEVIAGARSAAADFLGCTELEVVFGPNMTTLTFALSHAVARTLKPGDEVVVTTLDHDANIAPWLLAAEDSGAQVRWVDFNLPDCTLDLDSLGSVLSEKTKVVAFTLASNALGTIPPVKEIVQRVRQESEALIVADAVHSAPHRSIDVASLGVDILFCSPYKFFGPHLGLMHGRKELLDGLQAYKVRPAPGESPGRWETGTKNHEGMAGLTACIDYIASLADASGDRRTRIVAAMAAIADHEAALSAAFLEGISRIDGVTTYGLTAADRVAERTPTFALRIDGMSPQEASRRLGERGIFTWDGNYYALAAMERLGLEDSGGALRIGFCHYHSVDDVERVLIELSDLVGS